MTSVPHQGFYVKLWQSATHTEELPVKGDISEKGGRIHVETEVWLSSALFTDIFIIYIIKSPPDWLSAILGLPYPNLWMNSEWTCLFVVLEQPSAFVGKITVLFVSMNREKSTVKINN